MVTSFAKGYDTLGTVRVAFVRIAWQICRKTAVVFSMDVSCLPMLKTSDGFRRENLEEFAKVKDLAWKLFKETGKIAYYQLYKDLSDGRNDKSGGASRNRLQGE